MAIVTNNDLTLGLRGRVGKYFVFRTFGGKTIASHAPQKPDPRKQSDAQRKTRARFREAAAWAVQTLRNSEQRRYFEQRAKDAGLTNAYTAAIQERMRCSSGLDGDRVSIEEKAAKDQKPPSTPMVGAPEPSLTKGSACRLRQRNLSFPASVSSRKPIINPARICPVELYSRLKFARIPHRTPHRDSGWESDRSVFLPDQNFPTGETSG